MHAQRETPGQSECHSHGLHTEGRPPSFRPTTASESAQSFGHKQPNLGVEGQPSPGERPQEARPQSGSGSANGVPGEVKGSYQMQQVAKGTVPPPGLLSTEQPGLPVKVCRDATGQVPNGSPCVPGPGTQAAPTRPGRSMEVGAGSPRGPTRPSEPHTLPGSAAPHPRHFGPLFSSEGILNSPLSARAVCQALRTAVTAGQN